MGLFYVTTPIYYVNDVPHLGTAYTTVVADALRRFHLLTGDDTFMLTGTDEHGQKIERQAAEQGLEPKAFVDAMSARFREAWPKLSVEADRFIRTTDPDHEAFVQDLWRKVRATGDLYEGTYEDWYCVGCESFKTEKELEPGNICPMHKKPVERVKEETFFFRLSKWEKPLKDLYARRPELIQPQSRRNEVLSFLEGGLRDLSVSRTTFTWGVPVPDAPKHIMYVWFDALANYRSALGTGAEARFWSKDSTIVHIVGKDILRFHSVYWPAFLLSAGYSENELPIVFAHGFLTIDGQKMSKTLRNAVDPVRLAEELGPDVLRYHLLRAVAFGQDGDFDHHALIERYNADLGKNLGNLLNRVLGLCNKLAEGKVPALGEVTPLEQELFDRAKAELGAARAAWIAIEPHRALEATWAISSAANQYIDRAAPWAAVKTDPARAHTILAALLAVLREISTAIWPVMPTKANEMRAQLGLPAVEHALGKDAWPTGPTPMTAGHALAPSGALFPTFDEDGTKAILAKLSPPKEGEAPAPAAKPAAPAPPSEDTGVITYDDFAKVDLRVGVVKTCEKVPKKDKLLELTVDVGEAEPRQIIAGLALSFTPETLVGRRVVVVANLAPRDFGKGKVSHGMLLATGPSEALQLATVEGDVAPGARLK
jgi:methionyl-tRNA synthetase